MTTLLWDQHTCLPLTTDTDIGPLTRYQFTGGTVVSVNAGYSPHGFSDAVALLHHYRAAIDAHPGLELAATLDEVDAATQAGRIAVVFDLEDSRPLDDDLENVRKLANFGCAPCCRPTTTPTAPAAAASTAPMVASPPGVVRSSPN